MQYIITLLEACWTVLGQMSPYLLLGFTISGVLSVLMSTIWIERHLGGGRISSVVKATLVGVPIPLCSCGVIPVATSLKRSGASKGATTAFLISTPQTGVDSILATYGLLGPLFAIFRPVAALLTGIIGGTAVTWSENEPVTFPVASSENSSDEPVLTFGAKVIAALKYAYITLPADISKALVMGILIAGIISTFLSGTMVTELFDNYILSFVIMLAIGLPLYSCSTSSIPIALGFMKMGVTPGAALVFLIAGPATNAATITVVWKVLGKRSTIIYLLTVLIGAIVSGLAFDFLNQTFADTVLTEMADHTILNPLEKISAVLMLIIISYNLYCIYTKKDSCSTDTKVTE